MSPPPAMVKAPALVAALTSSNIFKLPPANAAISKTPYGPFQMIVFALLTASVFNYLVFSPQSRPIHSPSIPVVLSNVLVLALASNLSPQTKSTGRMILTFFYFAFAIISGTIFAPSSS